MKSGIHPAHAANRLRAVMLMLETLPPVRSARELDGQVKFLASLSASNLDDAATAKEKAMRRACWANRSGVKSEPSPETWALFVEAARLRKPIPADETRRRFA